MRFNLSFSRFGPLFLVSGCALAGVSKGYIACCVSRFKDAKVKYDAEGRIFSNAKGNKMLTDTPAQLKFTADVPLGKGIGWGYTSGMLSVSDGLTFTYCKASRTLVITGKYGLGF